MPRALTEWVGSSDDAAIPAHVRLRIFEAQGGVCYLSGRKIHAGEPWDLDHIKALCNGGQHRESNLAPVLRDKHREKTKTDLAEKSRANRKRSKHLGIKKAKSSIPGSRNSKWRRRMDGTVEKR